VLVEVVTGVDAAVSTAAYAARPVRFVVAINVARVMDTIFLQICFSSLINFRIISLLHFCHFLSKFLPFSVSAVALPRTLIQITVFELLLVRLKLPFRASTCFYFFSEVKMGQVNMLSSFLSRQNYLVSISSLR
jgi:hypothetical protein